MLTYLLTASRAAAPAAPHQPRRRRHGLLQRLFRLKPTM
jgi:hypothetical protein